MESKLKLVEILINVSIKKQKELLDALRECVLDVQLRKDILKMEELQAVFHMDLELQSKNMIIKLNHLKNFLIIVILMDVSKSKKEIAINVAIPTNALAMNV